MGRMVVVGGEVQSRGLFGGNRTPPEWVGLSVAIGGGLLIVLAGGSSVVALISAAVLVLAGVVLTTPNKFSGHRSLGAIFVELRHKKVRAKNKSLVYVPVKDRPQTRMIKAGKKDRERADENGHDRSPHPAQGQRTVDGGHRPPLRHRHPGRAVGHLPAPGQGQEAVLHGHDGGHGFILGHPGGIPEGIRSRCPWPVPRPVGPPSIPGVAYPDPGACGADGLGRPPDLGQEPGRAERSADPVGVLR